MDIKKIELLKDNKADFLENVKVFYKENEGKSCKNLYSFYKQTFKDYDFNDMMDFYGYSSDYFFILDGSENEDDSYVLNQWKINGKHLINLLYIDNASKQEATILKELKNLSGIELHQCHKEIFIDGYKKLYEEWYLSQGGLEKHFLLNLFCNSICTPIVKKIGLYWLFEKDEYNEDEMYINSIESSKTSHNYIKTRCLRQLVNKKFKEADRKSFTQFINTYNYPNLLIRKIIDKQRRYVINRINERKYLTILESYQLRDLIALGYDYLKLANTTKKNFKLKQVLNMFPMQSNDMKLKLKNKKLNEKSRIIVEDYSDKKVMESVWDSFFEEVEIC